MKINLKLRKYLVRISAIVMILANICLINAVAAVEDPFSFGSEYSYYNDKCENTAADNRKTVLAGLQVNNQTTIQESFGDLKGYARNTSSVADPTMDCAIVYSFDNQDIQGFIARGYMANESHLYFDFYLSQDNKEWVKFEPEHTLGTATEDGGFVENIYSANVIDSGYKYLKVQFSKEETNTAAVWRLQLGDVKIWYKNNEYSASDAEFMGQTAVKNFNSLDEVDSSGSTMNALELVTENRENYKYDVKRIKVLDNTASLTVSVPEDSLSGLALWTLYDEYNDNDIDFSFVGKDGTLTPTTAQKTVNGIEVIYIITDVPANIKGVRLGFTNVDVDKLQIGKAEIGYSKLMYNVLDKGYTQLESGEYTAYAQVTNRQEIEAPATLIAFGKKGTQEIIRVHKENIPAGKTKRIEVNLPSGVENIKLFVCDTIEQFHDISSYPYNLYEVTIEFDITDNVITTSGRIKGKGEKYVYVILTREDVTNEELSGEYLDESVISSIYSVGSFSRTGVFQETYQLPAYIAPDYYNYKVSAGGSPEVLTGKVLIASRTDKDNAVKYINESTEVSGILGLLNGDGENNYEKIYVSLGMEMSEYKKLSDTAKLNVATKMFNEDFAQSQDTEFTTENISSYFNSYVYFEAMNEVTDIEQYKKLILRIKEFTDFEEAEEWEKLNSLSDDLFSKLCTNLIGRRPFTDYDNMTEKVRDSVIVQLFNGAVYDKMEGLFEKYNSDLEIPTESYNKYLNLNAQNKATVNKAMVYNGYTSFTQIVAKLEEALSAIGVKRPNPPSYGGGGGGGSSSSGGGMAVSVQANAQNNVPSEEEIKTALEKESAFNDLDSVPWAKTAIEYLADKGAVSGVGNGQFNPNAPVLREQAIKMIVNAFEFTLPEKPEQIEFSDVYSGEWYYPYISLACSEEIANGQGEKFGIGEEITRQDLTVLIYRAAKMKKNIKSENSSSAFNDDGEIADYAKDAVYALVANGAINGVGDNKFAPLESCTRAAAAKMIYSLIVTQ